MLGCGQPGGEAGDNLARVVAVLTGLDSVPRTTLNRFYASSLQTTRMAMHAIRAREGDVILYVGVETVGRYQFGMADGGFQARNAAFISARDHSETAARGGVSWTAPRLTGRLPDAYLAMGQTAKNMAKYCRITRVEQDEFGVRSQNLAEVAVNNGFWPATSPLCGYPMEHWLTPMTDHELGLPSTR